MGGRGSAYIVKQHTSSNDSFPDIDTGYKVSDFDTDIETEYHNEMFDELKKYKISVRKSTDDIDDKILERQEKTVLSIAKKYNKLLSLTSDVQDIQLGAEKFPSSGVLAYCAPNIKNGTTIQRVVLNKKYLKNYDKYLEVVDYGIKTKQFVPVNQTFNSRDYILTHEFGHAIENAVFEKVKKDNNLYFYTISDYSRLSDIFATRIKNEVIKICQDKYKNGKMLKKEDINLSSYASNDDFEWFAETFTNLELAEKPAPIALALGDYLGRML